MTRLTAQRHEAYPSGRSTTTLAPFVCEITLPCSLFNHRKAPLSALPLLPPTNRPSRRISFLTASNDSSSSVLIHESTCAGSRDRTSGTKSYPIPSTMYSAPASAVFSSSGYARMLPLWISKPELDEVTWCSAGNLQGRCRRRCIWGCALS